MVGLGFTGGFGALVWGTFRLVVLSRYLFGFW